MLLLDAQYHNNLEIAVRFILCHCGRSSDILKDGSPLILNVQAVILDCLALKVKAL